MLRHGDTIRQKGEYVSSEHSATQHRIQLAKSVLLISLPEIASGRNTMTVLNTVIHPMEPVFTREVA